MLLLSNEDYATPHGLFQALHVFDQLINFSIFAALEPMRLHIARFSCVGRGWVSEDEAGWVSEDEARSSQGSAIRFHADGISKNSVNHFHRVVPKELNTARPLHQDKFKK